MPLQIVEEKSLLRQGYQSPFLIGRGAHAMVYRVRESATGKFYACKVGREGGIWEKERMLLANIQNPLFPYYGKSWQERESYFLVMEYIPGKTLAEMLKQRGHLTQRQAMKVAISLAEGLAYLEALPEEILFRDLKPQNVKIREDGCVKLLDLGCACPAGQAGHTLAGTLGYAAPEQLAASGQAGAYSDVYAFGKMLHYMLTGDDPCLPPQKKLPIRTYDKKLDGRLECLVEECVKEKIGERLPDMRCVLHRLQDLEKNERKIKGKNFLLARQSRRTEFLYEKNVFKAGGSS